MVTLEAPASRLLLALEEQLDDLRRDFARPLVQLGVRQVRDRMRQREELVVRQAPGLRHRMARALEDVGDNGCGGNADLLEQDSVEHTARRAGPSVAGAGGDGVDAALRLVDDLV